MASSRNTGIQWMRALAALLVVVDHGLFTLIEKAGADATMAPLAVRLGSVGVEIFFVISGFVMVASSTRVFGAAASAAFVRRRLIRIVPLYWLTTAVYALKLAGSGEHPTLADLARSLLFVPYRNAAGEIQPLYGLGWTLNCEMLFYLVFALGLLGSLRSTIGLACTALGGLVLLGGFSAFGTDGLGTALSFWSRPIILFFLAGLAVPALVERWRAHAALSRLPFGLALLLAALCVGLAVLLGSGGGLTVLLHLLLLTAAVLLVSAAEAGPAQGRLARVASALGDASYSIYLTHSFVIGPLGRLYGRLGWHSSAAFVALSLLVCAGVGVLCFRHVEQPILAWLSARTRRGQPRPFEAA